MLSANRQQVSPYENRRNCSSARGHRLDSCRPEPLCLSAYVWDAALPRLQLRQEAVHEVGGTAQGLVGGVDQRVDERVCVLGCSVSGPAHGVDDRVGG